VKNNDGDSGGPGDDDYEVGYGKPPKATRFRKGTSGNPKGRPRGSKKAQVLCRRDTFVRIVMEEVDRKVRVNDGNRVIEVTALQAVLRSLGISALKGSYRAQAKFIAIAKANEDEQNEGNLDAFKAAVEYKEWATQELETRKQAKKSIDDIIPHPEDIRIDPWAGTAVIVGPLTPEEKKKWAAMKSYIKRSGNILRDLEEQLRIEKDPNEKQGLIHDIEGVRERVDSYKRTMADRWLTQKE